MRVDFDFDGGSAVYFDKMRKSLNGSLEFVLKVDNLEGEGRRGSVLKGRQNRQYPRIMKAACRSGAQHGKIWSRICLTSPGMPR